MKKRQNKYAIHILPITAISMDVFDTPKNLNALIVCTNRTLKYREFFDKDKILEIIFPDVEDPDFSDAFNDAHAGKIIDFLKNLPSDITDLYICCSKGESRSPAIAAAALRMSGRSDKNVWLNPFYAPNTLVYYKLCKSYGVPISRLTMKIRKFANNISYKISKNRGNTGKYEGWQILE